MAFLPGTQVLRGRGIDNPQIRAGMEERLSANGSFNEYKVAERLLTVLQDVPGLDVYKALGGTVYLSRHDASKLLNGRPTPIAFIDTRLLRKRVNAALRKALSPVRPGGFSASGLWSSQVASEWRSKKRPQIKIHSKHTIFLRDVQRVERLLKQIRESESISFSSQPSQIAISTRWASRHLDGETAVALSKRKDSYSKMFERALRIASHQQKPLESGWKSALWEAARPFLKGGVYRIQLGLKKRGRGNGIEQSYLDAAPAFPEAVPPGSITDADVLNTLWILNAITSREPWKKEPLRYERDALIQVGFDEFPGLQGFPKVEAVSGRQQVINFLLAAALNPKEPEETAEEQRVLWGSSAARLVREKAFQIQIGAGLEELEGRMRMRLPEPDLPSRAALMSSV